MKITLTDVKSGYNLTPLNTNFEAIEQELQNKVLYRNNPAGEPNQMESSLDMNSNDVLNVNNLSVTSFKINGEDSTQFLNASVVEAYNWAQYAEDVPVPEGTGTEFSSYHYSIKAGDSADAAETAEDNAELALYTFNGTWYGALASEPVTDPNGDAINDGDLYSNSTDGILYFYQGATWNPLGGGDVTSAFGRTGAVVALAGDYGADQVTYDNTTSGLTATDTQAAIDEVEGRLDTAESTVATIDSEYAPYISETVALDNHFISASVKCTKIGDTVTITGTAATLDHTDGLSQPTTSAGVIPAAYRPTSGDSHMLYTSDAAGFAIATVQTDGTFYVTYRDYTGAGLTRNTTIQKPTITYAV